METIVLDQIVYAVHRNSDRTEGRGHDMIVCHTSSLTTALRLSKGIDVMGSDGLVTQEKCAIHKGRYYASIAVIPPTKEDLEADRLRIIANDKAQEKKKILEKAKKFLSEEEIKILESKD